MFLVIQLGMLPNKQRLSRRICDVILNVKQNNMISLKIEHETNMFRASVVISMAKVKKNCYLRKEDWTYGGMKAIKGLFVKKQEKVGNDDIIMVVAISYISKSEPIFFFFFFLQQNLCTDKKSKNHDRGKLDAIIFY
ncbi:hypothetical protein RFI_26126 [Reticulomyxa filosa]|uniref:Uncharacterized protein n=1 Tax=Reticulomyxa filosa TaxID=46433 RepID=X6MBJ3_RETFI|nr:hypothetical protein RFI_26126 [Reticulomyxa filosa]|eukprot:ETO11249.1 hypothetical protein RFI_26126 [Reticulomyxa filosa]